jgi:hypothetical protein
VLEWVLDAIDEHGVLLSDSLDEDAYYMNGLDMIGLDIEELMPVWNDDPRLPALIRLCHPGDQQVFIYVTERDEQGEYPVVRFEGKENDLWLAESSLIEYLQEIFAGSEESHDEWQHQQPSTRHAMAPCWSWNIFMRIFTPGSKVALTNSPSPAESALNGRRRGQLQEGALNP